MVHSSSDSPARRPAHTPSHVLSWIGLTGILTIAAARCVIAFAPQIAFDTDPAFDDSIFFGIAPSGSMTLDALLLLACAIALTGQWLSGRRVHWIITLLALIPAPIVLRHGWSDAGNLWLGSTMLAAAVACATIAHLARDPAMRVVIIAVLLAATVPVFARGIVQVAHEHPLTVRFYEEHKEAFLRDRGWPPDSPAARIYERRLKQPQPTGWFATTNVLASLAAFTFVFCAGLASTAFRARMQSGWGGSMILCALLAAAMVWLSGSKGAALATIAGIALLAVAYVALRHSTNTRRSSLAAIALVLLAIAGVIIRGTILPENFAGDRSLLFRWHYWLAAARMMMEHPFAGVGPDGFQAAYVLHRIPRSPEEVTSAHSVFIDWLAMLGVFGAAWIIMVLAIVHRAGRNLDAVNELGSSPSSGDSRNLENVRTSAPRQPNVDQSRASRIAITIALIVLVVGILPAHVLEWPAIDGVGFVARLLGAVGFVCVAIIAHGIALCAAGHLAFIALVGATTALLVHGQIEMTFVQPGTMVWAMVALGSMGLPPNPQPTRRSPLVMILVAIILTLAGVMAYRGVIPAYGQQSRMLEAAAMLRPIASEPANHELMLRQRRAAAAQLVRAYESWPSNVHPLNAAARQLQLTAAARNGPQPIGLLLEARDLIDRAIDHHSRSDSMVIAIDINIQLAMITGDAEHWRQVIDLARQLTQRDPHGVSSWRRLGDVLWIAGERVAAADAYRRALQNDANFELDPDKQLLPQQRRAISDRVKESETS